MKSPYAAAFAFLAIALGSSSAVQADPIIASFASGATADYSYTGGSAPSGPSTLNSVGPLGGFVLFGSSFFSPVGPYGTTITLTSSSSTAASGTTQTGFSGTLTIANASGGPVGGVANGNTFLTVTFTNAELLYEGGSAYSFGGSATITPAPGFGAPIVQPESFSLSLTGATNNTGSLGPFGFGNFLANDSGNASATFGAVPEPSTMAIAAVGALGMIGYGLRRRKARVA